MRTLILTAVGLAIAAAIPWGYYSAAGYWKGASLSAATGAGQGGGRPQDVAPAAAIGAKTTDASLGKTPIQDLDGVFRFDVTPEALYRRWPRVSTGLGQLQLQGYRVPLVTGTAEDDLAGALTYYFNPQLQVQRITFFGSTGNPQKLLTLLGSRFGFARRVLNAPGMLVYEAPESDGAARSAVRIEAAEVIKADEPNLRYKVSLVLERPAGG